jgi:hypothetical protein
MEIVFWGTLVVLAVGAPVLGVLSPRFELGQRWMSPVLAVAVGGVTLLLIGAGFTVARASLRRRDLAAGMAATFGTGAAVMLLLQYPVMRGYSAYATSDLKPLAEAVWEKHPDARIVEYEPGTRTRTYLDLPIYAGRTTSKERDLLALRPGERPVVAVFFSRRGDVPALPEPWQPLASGEGRKDSWQAFVLPAAR